jgi:hypothetical protein
MSEIPLAAAQPGRPPKTVGADKGYDNGPLLVELEKRGIEPHVAMVNKECADPEKIRGQRRVGIEARRRMRGRLASVGYQLSQKTRKKVEECFGWLKTIAGLDRSRWIGRWKLKQYLEDSSAAYNLLRIAKLQVAS